MHEDALHTDTSEEKAQRFVAMARQGPITADAREQLIASIPARHQHVLIGVVRDMLEASDSLCSVEENRRIRSEGIKLLVLAGFSFPKVELNRSFIPIVLRLVRESYDQQVVSFGNWHELVERASALAQLAPLVEPAQVNQCIETLLYCARIPGQDQYQARVVGMLTAFGPALKPVEFEDSQEVRERARILAVGAMSRLLLDAVENIAGCESDAKQIVMDQCRAAHWACDELLSVLPALSAGPSEATSEGLDGVVDSLEWLVRRPRGYPGDDFQVIDQRYFEFLRSTASIVLGIILIHFPEYEEGIRDMQLRRFVSGPSKGEAFLRVILQHETSSGVELARELILSTLKEAGSTNAGLTPEECFETSVLAWHLGAVPSTVLERAFNAMSPRFFLARAYLTRALAGDAWAGHSGKE